MAEAAGSGSYLGDAELAGGQLTLCLVHLLAALGLGALQLFQPLHHRLHIRLHLADVETRHGELFVEETTAVLLLRGSEEHSRQGQEIVLPLSRTFSNICLIDI